jgi:Uma2 family endonuclease
MATQPHSFITAEQFYRLPQEDGREFELLDGEVTEMSSPTVRHNRIVMKLVRLLSPALQVRDELLDNTDFSPGELSILRPDLAILLGEKPSLIDPDKLPVTVAPDIVVEVISPSENAWKVDRKVQVYLQFGVQEVWTIYPQDQRLYSFTAAKVLLLQSHDTLQTPLLPGWSVTVAQLFD